MAKISATSNAECFQTASCTNGGAGDQCKSPTMSCPKPTNLKTYYVTNGGAGPRGVDICVTSAVWMQCGRRYHNVGPTLGPHLFAVQ